MLRLGCRLFFAYEEPNIEYSGKAGDGGVREAPDMISSRPVKSCSCDTQVDVSPTYGKADKMSINQYSRGGNPLSGASAGRDALVGTVEELVVIGTSLAAGAGSIALGRTALVNAINAYGGYDTMKKSLKYANDQDRSGRNELSISMGMYATGVGLIDKTGVLEASVNSWAFVTDRVLDTVP